MKKHIYHAQCENCGEDVYGVMTSSDTEIMTILYECAQCGYVWSEEVSADDLDEDDDEVEDDE